MNGTLRQPAPTSLKESFRGSWDVPASSKHFILKAGVSRPPFAQRSISMSCREVNRSGFTLIEALVTVILFLFIYGACTLILLSGTDAWQIRSVNVELRQELRKAMEKIKDDLSQSGASAITGVPADDTWHTTMTFQTAVGVSSGIIQWGVPIQYVLGGTDANQIHRVQGIQDHVVAHDILSMEFRRSSASPDMTEIALQARKNTLKGRQLTESLTFQVQLRN